MAITLASMVADLKIKSQVQGSELYADSVLESLIISAGKKHNAFYVISSTACTVPDLESDVIVLLAWIDFCYVALLVLPLSPVHLSKASARIEIRPTIS
jgi:hypothetical protein